MGYSQNGRNRHKEINNHGGTEGTKQSAGVAGKEKNKRQNPVQRNARKAKNVIGKPTSSTDKVGRNVEGKEYGEQPSKD